MQNSQINHIFECCRKGDTQQVLDALDLIENHNIIDSRQNSVLSIALRHGYFSMASALIDKNYIYHSPERPLLISACQCPMDDISGISLVVGIENNANIQDSKKRTPLMTACLLGHIQKVENLFSLEADCELQDNEGNTALFDAIHSRNKELIQLILKNKPSINKSNNNGETALILELKQKKPEENIIKQLLDAGADPEQTDSHNKSAWLIAKQKHPKISRLIETHLNSINQIELPFFTNDYKPITSTPADRSNIENKVVENKVESVTKENIESDKKENLTTIQKFQTPARLSALFPKKKKKNHTQEWFHAARTGNLGTLNRMILDGVDINCTDNKGCTALIRASGHSRRAVVSFLLQNNANLEIKSSNGSTALSSSIIGDSRHVAELLLEKGADPNGRGPSGYNYITIAAAQWNDAMLSILYRNGADIFIENKKGQNLLHIIAMAAEHYNNINNAKNCISFLLDHGMDINSRDVDGNSPLMILCGTHKMKYKTDDRNLASLAHFMIKKGAAPAITNNSGKAAIDAAGYHKMIQTKGVLMNALSWND